MARPNEWLQDACRPGRLIEITPLGEESWHIRDKSCECDPRIEIRPHGVLMIIHNSWDGREAYERPAPRMAA